MRGALLAPALGLFGRPLPAAEFGLRQVLVAGAAELAHCETPVLRVAVCGGRVGRDAAAAAPTAKNKQGGVKINSKTLACSKLRRIELIFCY